MDDVLIRLNKSTDIPAVPLGPSAEPKVTMVATADSAGFGGPASMARADDPRSKRQSHGSKVQTLHGTRNVVKRRVLDILSYYINLYYILLVPDDRCVDDNHFDIYPCIGCGNDLI